MKKRIMVVVCTVQGLRDILPGLDPSYLPQAGTDYAGMLRVANEAFGQSAAADRFLSRLS